MRLVTDTLSQANRENAPSFTDELRRLLIKLSPLKQAEELLKQKISPPQEEEGDTQMVVSDSTEFAVRSASGWKQAFNKMRGVAAAASREDVVFDNGSARILENCAEDMIGHSLVTPFARPDNAHFLQFSYLDKSRSEADPQATANKTGGIFGIVRLSPLSNAPHVCLKPFPASLTT